MASSLPSTIPQRTLAAKSSKTTIAVSSRTGTGLFAFHGWTKLRRVPGQKDASGVLIDFGNTQWGLHVYAGGRDETAIGKVSVFCVCFNVDGDFEAEIAVMVVDHEGRAQGERGSSVVVRNGKRNGWNGFCKRSLIDSMAQASADDSITFKLSVTLRIEMRSTAPLPVHVSEVDGCPASGLQALSESFGTLWESGEHSDVTLQVAGVELQAHRAVLAARSPVFAKMLATTSEMVEASTGVVHVTDVDAPTAKRLCRFIYTAALDDDDDIWADHAAAGALVLAATKYEVLDLARACVRAVTAALTVDNAAEWLVLGCQLTAQVPELLASCLKFAAAHMSEVQSTQGWARLKQNKAVAAEVYPMLLEVFIPPATKKQRTRRDEGSGE